MSIKSGSMDLFESFSQFSSLTEFNYHMEMWLAEHKHEFTKGELVGLKRLVRYAAKIPGVCNAKIGTILKAIHEQYQGNGISRSTFKRMIQKAVGLGIIIVHETERKNGSQSSNLYVFNRFPTVEPPNEEKLNHPNKTILLSKTKNQVINKRKETASTDMTGNEHHSTEAVLDFSYTNDRVPTPFVQLVKCFFADAKTIEEYWRMTTIAAYRHHREKEPNQVLEMAIQSFKQLISKLKSKTKVNKPVGYFFGILNKKLEGLYFQELFEMGFGEGEGEECESEDFYGQMFTMGLC